MHIETKASNWYVDIKLHSNGTVIDMWYEDIDSLWYMMKEIYSVICYKLWDRFYDWEEWKKYIDELLDLWIKDLQHHKDTTVWLYATDVPEVIPYSIKENFFEL